MTLRYLYGPVAADFAARNLAGPRRRGECLAFDLHGGADLSIAPADTWDDVPGGGSAAGGSGPRSRK
jgi:hypothetical protein